MASAETFSPSIRITRAESRRVTLALLVSLALHLLGWGAYFLGKQLDWWNLARWPHWTQRLVQRLEPPPPPPHPPQEMMMQFLDVSHPSPDAPDKAKYYASKNSRAANAQIRRENNEPDIQGHPTQVLKTEDVTKPVFSKAPPAPKAAQQPDQKARAEQQNPTPKEQPEQTRAGKPAGDVAPGKATPQTEEHPEDRLHAQPRPRSIKQALAQRARQNPSRAMEMAGGTKQIALTSALDAKATPFGEYDQAMVDAVASRWYQLLDSQRFAWDRTGLVTVKFHLNFDGTATEVHIDSNSVGALLGEVCAEAIDEAAPFAPWPADMRNLIDKNYREISFTFDYLTQ